MAVWKFASLRSRNQSGTKQDALIVRVNKKARSLFAKAGFKRLDLAGARWREALEAWGKAQRQAEAVAR